MLIKVDEGIHISNEVKLLVVLPTQGRVHLEYTVFADGQPIAVFPFKSNAVEACDMFYEKIKGSRQCIK